VYSFLTSFSYSLYSLIGVVLRRFIIIIIIIIIISFILPLWN